MISAKDSLYKQKKVCDEKNLVTTGSLFKPMKKKENLPALSFE